MSNFKSGNAVTKLQFKWPSTLIFGHGLNFWGEIGKVWLSLGEIGVEYSIDYIVQNHYQFSDCFSLTCNILSSIDL